jgi:hypothetical protein
MTTIFMYKQNEKEFFKKKTSLQAYKTYYSCTAAINKFGLNNKVQKKSADDQQISLIKMKFLFFHIGQFLEG